MKRHLQCAEQQASPSNLTKYCSCHARWLSWLISLTYETSFTMRGETDLIPQHHQMLRLPRKITRIIYPRDICNVISNARSNKHHPPTSPNTAPATQNDSHDWCPSHMTRHLQCAEQQISSSNITKCCACHVKKRLVLGPRLIWNVIYNAQSNRSHPPTSASAAPVTQNNSHHVSSWHMKRHLQYAEKHASPSNLTKCCPSRKMMRIIDLRHIWNVIYNARSNRHHPPTSPNTAPATQNCTPKSKKNLPKTAEASIPMRGRFEHDPTIIRTWSDHELVISHPPVRRGYFSRFGDAFCIENYNISRAGYLLKFHRILRLPRKVTLQHHQILRLPRKVPLQDDEILRLPRKVTLQDHQILRLPRKVTLIYDSTELLLNWAVTELLLNCYWTVTQLLLNWPVTKLSCYSTATGLLLNCYWTDLLLNRYWYWTELLLYWAVTLLSYYLTELLLHWAVTWLSCYFTVTLLSCYFTELFLYWAVTWLRCFFTELLLYWAVTLLSCYFTELLLDWTVTSLSCYLTELLLYFYFTELLLY